MALCACSGFTQEDGDLFLPVKGHVTMDMNKSGKATVTVYEGNQEISSTKTSGNGVFWVELDLGKVYSLHIQTENSSAELIQIDTHLPDDVMQYPAYECFVDLRAARVGEAKFNYYLDFPSAVVRYDRDQEGFYHSEAYHGHIQTKLGQLANVGF